MLRFPARRKARLSGGNFQLESNAVANHGDKFRIRGLSLGIADGIAKEFLQGFQIAPVPCHFNGVAYGAFHPAGGGMVALGYLRIEDLGDGIDRSEERRVGKGV